MRHPDWQPRLTAYLAECSRAPFVAGRHDCAMFAAGAVHVMGGPDIARGWRGYRTMREGVRNARKRGFRDHVAIFRDALPPALPPRPGDVAVVPTDEGPSLGIVQGARIYVVGEIGWGLVPIERGVEFMRVG